MNRVAVVKAYKSDHYPVSGNLSEEVLVLADGRAVYLNPGLPDEIYDDEGSAVEACVGDLTTSESLLQAWNRGYEA